jgi:prephenate dehydrogenase
MSADERFVPLMRAGQVPAGGSPIFERVGIVGLGLIGGSIALAARQAWPSALVIGVDSNEVVEQAVVLHAIDVAASDLTIVSEADLVILAAPLGENLRLLARLPDYVDKPVVVTDVGSAKRAIVDAASNLPPHFTFVGGHPLGGSTGTGIQAARADLFAGRPWLFTPSAAGAAEPAAGAHEPVVRLFEFARGLGARPEAIDPVRHDHLMAFISHMPQMLVSALMQVVGDEVGDEGLALSGRGLRDTTRLAGSPTDIWTDVCAGNADEIGPALDAIIVVLQRLRGNLDKREAIAEVFAAARRWRAALTDPRG